MANIELTSEIEPLARFVAEAVFAGVVGNEAHTWWKSLLLHKKVNLKAWAQSSRLTPEELDHLRTDMDLLHLFSSCVDSIMNEVSPKKVKAWACITNAIVQKTTYSINKRRFYVAMFNQLHDHTLHFLASLQMKRRMHHQDVFDLFHKSPELGSPKSFRHLGYMQAKSQGLVMSTPNPAASKGLGRHMILEDIYLSEVGADFLKFIGAETIASFKEE